MRPVRVVHVLQSVESGGAEQQLLALVKALDRKRWEAHVLCTHEVGSLGPEFEAAGVPVQAVGKRGRFDFALAARLANRLAQIGPAVVHTWMPSGNFWGRLASLKLSPRPVVVASERSVDEWYSPTRLMLDRVLSRLGDAVIGNSTRVTQFLVEHKRYRSDGIVTIPNGVSLDRTQAALDATAEERRAWRVRAGIPADAFVVGNIAQPIAEKRLDLLVELVVRLRRTGLPVHVLQLGRDARPGEEAYFAWYLRLIDDAGIAPYVHRRGFVREISPELASMDVLVQTSDIEGMPNAVMEALAMEVPVVATGAGGTADLVLHRRTGWLVAVGDVDGLERGVLHVRDCLDEARIWARAGREHIERTFSVEALAARTTALYARLLRERGFALPDQAGIDASSVSASR